MNEPTKVSQNAAPFLQVEKIMFFWYNNKNILA